MATGDRLFIESRVHGGGVLVPAADRPIDPTVRGAPASASPSSGRCTAGGLVIQVEDRATELAVVSFLRSDVNGSPPAPGSFEIGVSVSHCERAPVGSFVVVVVTPTAAACASALAAVTSGTAMAALTAGELDRLPAIVRAVREGVSCVSEVTLELAAQMPNVAARGWTVLELAATGASVAQMASALRLSSATIKRELADLADLLGAHSRVELVLVARRLGIL